MLGKTIFTVNYVNYLVLVVCYGDTVMESIDQVLNFYKSGLRNNVGMFVFTIVLVHDYFILC